MTDSNKENPKKMVRRACKKGYVYWKIHSRLGGRMRMSSDLFSEILSAIEQDISKQSHLSN